MNHKPISPALLYSLLALAGLSMVYIIASNLNVGPTAPAGQHGALSKITGRTQLAQLSGTGSGLVGWWTFDEGSGTTAGDSSGSGNNGTLLGAPTWTTGEVGSGALTFNGTTQYVEVRAAGAPLGSLDVGTGPFSVSAWMKDTSAGMNQLFVGASRYSGWDLAILNGGESPTFSVTDGTLSDVAEDNSSINYDDNRWHLITGVRDGTHVILYIDGVQSLSAADRALNTDASVSKQAMRIGASGGSSASSWWNGSIDDVRIYNRALSAGEVSQLYALGSGGGGSTTYSLTVTNPNTSGGTVTSSPAGINCGSTCSASGITSGTSYTLTAAPNANYTTSWTGCGATTSGNTCTVSINSNTTVTVTFTLQQAPDTTPPTVPTSLTATAISSSQINLTWTASTDNVGVTGYTIYRGGSQIGTSVTNSYSDTGLTASTQYTYTVTAHDAVPNTSAQSTSASATTQASAGGNRVDLLDSSGTVVNTYTTIQACANAMQAGNTCKVYAGTYNEHVTVSSGTAGNYKTLMVNSGDAVYVLDFTVSSHDKIIGFHIQNPSSPASNDCVGINDGATDIYITSNTFYACGYHAEISGVTSGAVSSYVYIQNNTFSWPCSTSSVPNTCKAIHNVGDHHLVENNDITHASDAMDAAGDHMVIRNNTVHDMSTADCGTNSSNCHIDFVESEPSSNLAAQYNVYEDNLMINNLGSDGHAVGPVQGDACGGLCHNLIIRYNVFAHMGSGGILDDNALNKTVIPGFTYVKSYNNDWIDLNNFSVGNQLYGGSNSFTNNSTNGADINDLFYYPESLTSFNAYVTDSTTASTFTVGHDLAYCTASPCNIFGHNYGGPGAFTSDPGNQMADPKFANYAGNDFHLQSGSPAIGAGTNLTTVASGDSGSGTSLVVNDAAYFQDGYGLPGVQPDWIAIGSVSNVVQISSINYTTNTITLATPISRSSGQPIYLYKDSSGRQVLYGSAPDIGAIPYTGSVGMAYTILASAGTGGAISPSGSVSVNQGSSQPFTITPNSGYQVASISLDGSAVLPLPVSASGGTYTLSNVTANHSISVTFSSTLTPDVTPPTISISSPTAGATVNGSSISIAANSTDPTVSGAITSGVSSVQFKLDGIPISGGLFTGAPYSGTWDTTGVSNGAHTLTAVATDGAGNSATSNSITVTVNNTPIVGDFNHDGLVNSLDLSLLESAWNTSNPTYDLNHDGIVNSLDYVIMVQNWTP